MSDKSSDVIRTLECMLRDAGVEVRLHADVERLLISDGRAVGIVQGGRRMPFDAVILACGGLSYPSTGSTGEGYTLAKAAGHTVQPLHPSLHSAGGEVPRTMPRHDGADAQKCARLSVGRRQMPFYGGGGTVVHAFRPVRAAHSLSKRAYCGLYIPGHLYPHRLEARAG